MSTLCAAMTRTECVAILKDLSPAEVAQVENAVWVLLRHPEMYSTACLIKAHSLLRSHGFVQGGDDAARALLSHFA